MLAGVPVQVWSRSATTTDQQVADDADGRSRPVHLPRRRHARRGRSGSDIPDASCASRRARTSRSRFRRGRRSARTVIGSATARRSRSSDVSVRCPSLLRASSWSCRCGSRAGGVRSAPSARTPADGGARATASSGRPGTCRYLFRARLPVEAGYPYEAGGSPRIARAGPRALMTRRSTKGSASACGSRLTYANVMSTLAVFIALGGSSYAAVQLNGRDLRNASVPAKKLKPDSLTGRQIRERGASGACRRPASRTGCCGGFEATRQDLDAALPAGHVRDRGRVRRDRARVGAALRRRCDRLHGRSTGRPAGTGGAFRRIRSSGPRSPA